ncbi:unnamed protein product [Durusdinium trenchii]|uniref:Uncharacterized protein n=1 Tax=Durusdinium trenchii TaxID=1381693 RepID=A0ABP0NBM0_9DINO
MALSLMERKPMAKLMAMSRHEGRLPSQLVAQVVRLRYQASWTLRAAQIRRLFTPLRKSRRSLGARSSSQVQVLSAHVLRLSDGGTCTEARLSLQWTLPGGAQQVATRLMSSEPHCCGTGPLCCPGHLQL